MLNSTLRKARGPDRMYGTVALVEVARLIREVFPYRPNVAFGEFLGVKFSYSKQLLAGYGTIRRERWLKLAEGIERLQVIAVLARQAAASEEAGRVRRRGIFDIDEDGRMRPRNLRRRKDRGVVGG